MRKLLNAVQHSSLLHAPMAKTSWALMVVCGQSVVAAATAHAAA
jgi:hypothetical protein